MSGSDLWKKYCSFYEKPFSEQFEYNKQRMNEYFEKWKKTDLAKMLCKDTPQSCRDAPITTYNNYPMLTEFASQIVKTTQGVPRSESESLAEYYLRISRQVGATLDRYMTEPFYLCAKTTGTTGDSKWVAHGKTFWENYVPVMTSFILISCSDGWGGTKIKEGDTALNITAPIPYISGWGATAFKKHFNLIPPMEITDNLNDMKKKFYLVLKAIANGKHIDVAGGIGSMFYMICKYFVEPEEFYEEYYRSMSFGLKKMLLFFKILQSKLSRREVKRIMDYLPLKGVIVGGFDSQLYIDFFKKEFNLEPLHTYGSTEGGTVMRGDPDRKTDLVPDLKLNYLEFKTEEGEIRDLDNLKRGETYDLIMTPFGSLLFRYDMDDFFKVIDFRDDGMPIFAFEGRRKNIIDIYGYYNITPNIIVQVLSKAGLKTSDKWAVAKLLEPREHLCFLMEQTWLYSQKKAEEIIFNALKEISNDFSKYITDFNIKDPSEAIEVKYLRPGAFLRYSAIRAKMGYPIGQYKPPQLIPPDRMEIYDTLKGM